MAVKLFIDGTERTDLVRMGSLNVHDRVNNATDTASFVIEQYGTQTFKPGVNQEVVIEVDGVRRFGGVIVSVDNELSAHANSVYLAQCKDYSQFLDRKLVTERYEDTTLQAIVVDLVDRYADEDSFTSAGVEGATVKIKSVSFGEIPLSECFTKLASLTGYYWYVDYFKDVHFFKRFSRLAPFNLSDDTENYIVDSLILRSDFSQTRNTVTVRGGEVRGAARTELLAGDGERDTFPLGNKFAETPTVEVDGSPVTVGIDFLQNDEDFDCMWSFQQKYIRFTAGNIPALPGSGETNIEVTGIPLHQLVVRRSLAQSILTYGTYEHIIRNDSIRSRDEALQFALADLASYGAEIRAGSFDTYRTGLRSGHTISITSALRGIAEGFVIQAVRFRMISPTSYLSTVELATIKTLSFIDTMQALLTKESVESGQDETLLSFFELADAWSMTDSLDEVVVTESENYVVEQDVPASDTYPNPAIINRSTMAA